MPLSERVSGLLSVSSSWMVGLGLMVWIGSAVWVGIKAYHRGLSPALQFVWFVCVVCLPVVGVLIYMWWYRKGVVYVHTVRGGGMTQCVSCQRSSYSHHARCVFCGESLCKVCQSCGVAYPVSYVHCSDCGAPNLI